MNCGGGIWDVSGVRIRNPELLHTTQRPRRCSYTIPSYGVKNVPFYGTKKRLRLCPNAAVSLDLPLLPFNMNEARFLFQIFFFFFSFYFLRIKIFRIEECFMWINGKQVLVPSETKTLHLYEARYLALLEEVHSFLLSAYLNWVSHLSFFLSLYY